MKEKIDSKGKKSNPNKLNTKGCCFLCLQIVDFKTEKENETRTKPAVSLRCVRRHLKIGLPLPTTSTTPNIALENTEDIPQKEIEADLCKSCEEIVGQFSNSFLSLEKFQMEVNYWLSRIHHRISEASKKSDIVQNYSKRMTSDPETLTQLVFVDNLRKEIAKKGLEKQKCMENTPKVELFRLQNIQRYLIKPQQNDPSECNNGSHIESKEESFSDNDDMPPSSPLVITKVELQSEIPIPANPTKFEDGDATEPSPASPVTSNSAGNALPRISISVVSNRKMKMYNKNLKTGTLDCIRCQKKFKSSFGARCHYKSIHLGKRFKCDICGENYSTKQFLDKHKGKCNGSAKKVIAKAGTKTVFNSETGKYNCVKCKKEFAQRETVWRHYDSVHLHKRIQCEVCKKDFKHKSSFYAHKKMCKDFQVN